MLLTSVAIPAQIVPLSADFIPDVAPLGHSINFRIYNNTNQTWTTGSCDWFTIYAEDPATGQPDTSEYIEHALVCFTPPVVTPPGGILEWDWDQQDHCPACGTSPPQRPIPFPTPVPPGRYWFHAHPPGQSQWFSYSIKATANEPSLEALTPIRIGQLGTYQVKAPGAAGALFGVLFSFVANHPIGVVPGLGLDICLQAPLYSLGGGTLDALGTGTVSFQIPMNVGLIDDGFHLQAIIGQTNPTALTTTNAAVFSIRP